MITGNDLMNIDSLLSEQERVINKPEEKKQLIEELRTKIHEEMEKIKIKIKRK